MKGYFEQPPHPPQSQQVQSVQVQALQSQQQHPAAGVAVFTALARLNDEWAANAIAAIITESTIFMLFLVQKMRNDFVQKLSEKNEAFRGGGVAGITDMQAGCIGFSGTLKVLTAGAAIH